ncbi:hypothetical protein CMI38_06565 [Candidatus Pacearchaeota archaeon]|jgi:hypothetical protein|nr:hypothetical protein [Candidatus Pacearchaeota archaeon]|tara:strand:- start:661 stop:1062 length:402 start_codon:yes stop_codon:yes gene_type:complete
MARKKKPVKEKVPTYGPHDPGDQNDNPASLRAKTIIPLEGKGMGIVSKEKINAEEANKFQKLCFDVQKALHSDDGKRLSCRLKIITENKQAIVYQGMVGNVWGRLKANGRHSIYRHALNNLLKADKNTSKYFA